jgi:mannose-6-phosphate isomerase-like protein (cupin superfamily)
VSAQRNPPEGPRSGRAYSPSPRPNYTVPTAILRSTVTRHLWGDDESGVVADLIYASTEAIHALVFILPPGGAFRHSEEYRTVFAADELLHVLSGTMVLANPETGELQHVPCGESVFFGPDTWHHAFAHGDEPLHVLEFLAPPPASGSTGAYARTRPYLERPIYAREQGEGPDTLRLVRDEDVVWSRDLGVRVGTLAETPRLVVQAMNVEPGECSTWHAHGGDELLYVLAGTLWVRAHHAEATHVFELGPDDACLLPARSEHEYRNYGAVTVETLVGIAPGSAS